VPPRECRGLAHQDHADEKGDQPEGSEQDETRGHADAVAEDDHAEDDPGHRLRRGDAPQGGFRRRDFEGALHKPQPDPGDSYQRVSGLSWLAAAQSQPLGARFGLQADRLRSPPVSAVTLTLPG